MSAAETLMRGVRRLTGDGAWLRRLHPAYAEASKAFSSLAQADEAERERAIAALEERAYGWARETPYGARHAGRPGSAQSAWPALEKRQLRDDPEAFITRSSGVPAATGGSSGVPLALVRSPGSVAAEQGAIDHVLRLADIDPRRARIAVCRAQPLGTRADGSPVVSRRIGRLRLMLSPYTLDEAHIERYAAEIASFAPDVLMIHPTALGSLLELAERADARVSVPVVLTSSEVLLPGLRERAAVQLGARVVDLYGMAERVALAYSLEPGEYRFLAGYGAVELVPAATAATAPAATVSAPAPASAPASAPVSAPASTPAALAPYEILGTGLWNPRMPLVRYRTGDIALLPASYGPAEVRQVALGVLPFSGILGRADDWVLLPGGAKAVGMSHLLWGVEHVERMQVRQRADGSLVVAIAPAPGYGEADAERILANARTLVGEGLPVTVTPVSEFTVLPNGKSPFVVREGVPDAR